MLDQKKIESHIVSMEAAANMMLREARKVRSMLEIKDKPEKKDLTAIKYYERRQRSLNRNK
jgi:hypothetical protein